MKMRNWLLIVGALSFSCAFGQTSNGNGPAAKSATAAAAAMEIPLGGTTMEVAKADLLATKSLAVPREASADGTGLKVTGFTVGAVLNGDYYEAPSSGEHFTEQQQAIMAKAAPGSKVYLEQIAVTDSEGQGHRAGSVVLVLK